MLGQKYFFLVHPFLDKELKMYQDFSFVFKTHTKKCVKYSHKWIFLRKSHDQRASYGHWHTIRTPSLEADSCRWLRCYLGHLHTFQLGLAPLPSPASCSNTPQQSSRWVPSTKGDLDWVSLAVPRESQHKRSLSQTNLQKNTACHTTDWKDNPLFMLKILFH